MVKQIYDEIVILENNLRAIEIEVLKAKDTIRSLKRRIVWLENEKERAKSYVK